ncbi:DUF4019 domain-containing protein [Luteimonas aquatica]|uniref:DUF4019 domain-containing protein n=1 Tax=Luteimonas aquatica TaxID=450364 RepID=UPI001F58A611|nr:DUF4019 domain-containing protein [Luteimonas aquatica]
MRQAIGAPQGGVAEPGTPPPGDYISVRFAVQFASGQVGTELITTYRQEAPGTWQLAGYVLQ